MVEQPHDPTRCEETQYEPHEAVGAIVEHLFRFVALGDAKNGGCTERTDEGCAEVRELESENHSLRPMAIW